MRILERLIIFKIIGPRKQFFASAVVPMSGEFQTPEIAK